jgi:hypothetical protein
MAFRDSVKDAGLSGRQMQQCPSTPTTTTATPGRLLVLALRVAGRHHLRGYLQKALSKIENQTA